MYFFNGLDVRWLPLLGEQLEEIGVFIMLTKQTHLVYYGVSAHGIKLFVMFFWLKTKASARSFIKFPSPV